MSALASRDSKNAVSSSFNPALVGRAFVQASWPVAITTFTLDGKGGATVLTSMRGLSADPMLIDVYKRQEINDVVTKVLETISKKYRGEIRQ